MNIGFDAKRTFHNYTGLGNYSRIVTTSMSSIFPQHQYYLFTPSVPKDFFWNYYRDKKNIHVETPQGSLQKLFHPFWRSFVLNDDLQKFHIDVFHGLSNEIPFGISRSGVKSIITIHDLIFKRRPHYYRATDRVFYDWKSKSGCKEADHIIAVSRQTKEDIMELYGTPADKITIIYPAIDPIFFERYDEAEKLKVKNKFHLPSSFILYVGTIETRKNLLGLVKAFHEISDKVKEDLVVVGRATSYKNKVSEFIDENKLNDRILFLEGVLNPDLPLIYQLSKVIVFPSFYEGFGVPISEGLACGIPVITSDIPIFHETGGPETLYTNPSDPSDIANALLKVIQSQELQKKMIEAGSIHATRFTGKIASAEMMKVYELVTGKSFV